MIRFRLPALIAAGAIAVFGAGMSNPVAAATKPSPSPSAAAAPAPTATPETLDHAIPRLEAVLKSDPNNKDAMVELAGGLHADQPARTSPCS